MGSTLRWITLCLLGVFVATCGQTGPLTLPEEPQVQVEGQGREQLWSPATHLIP